MGKPSAYLQQMRQMAKKVGVGDDMVRHRFTQALPPSISPVVASQTKTALDDLGTLADDLMPLVKEQNVCELRTSGTNNFKTNAYFKNKPYFHANNKNISGDQPRSLTLIPFSENQRPKICRAHIFFGNKAKNCRFWCHWPNKSNCRIVNSRANTPVVSRSNSPTRQSNM